MIQFSPSLIPTQNQQQQLANVKGKLRSAQDQLQKDTDASYATFYDAKKKASAAGIVLKYPISWATWWPEQMENFLKRSEVTRHTC